MSASLVGSEMCIRDSRPACSACLARRKEVDATASPQAYRQPKDHPCVLLGSCPGAQGERAVQAQRGLRPARQ
eukprot:9319883-Alexandrium_andersonii.AAC.1